MEKFPVFKPLLRLLDPLTCYYLENLNMAIYHHELKKTIKTVTHLFDRVRNKIRCGRRSCRSI